MSTLSNFYNNDIDFEVYNSDLNQQPNIVNSDSVVEKIKYFIFNEKAENLKNKISTTTQNSYIDNNSEPTLQADSFENKFRKIITKNKNQ